MTSEKKSNRIAIIGSGISGLSCAWLLGENGFDVTIYERDCRIGGHANTYTLPDGRQVDTGFIVYNEWTYPNLIALFKYLNVETLKTDMSFGVSINNGHFEYGSDHLFAQKKNLFSFSYYRMLFDLVRFYKKSPNYIKSNEDASLGQYLKDNKYSDIFIEKHILPMAAAIWSMSADEAARYPMKSFLRFFENHGLLKLLKRPQWWTVKGGSVQYLRKMKHVMKCEFRIDYQIKNITRSDSGVNIDNEDYDSVVFACHPDQAFKMLNDSSEDEKETLLSFPYSKNTAVLHSDTSLMPKRKKAWSAWNYLGDNQNRQVCVSYWMNRLQTYLGNENNLFVTLNPDKAISPDKVFATFEYEHPQYDQNAIKAWHKISQLQGFKNTWYCGAWCGYGFHEDGVTSGLAVAEKLGSCKRPWHSKDISPAGKHATG